MSVRDVNSDPTTFYDRSQYGTLCRQWQWLVVLFSVVSFITCPSFSFSSSLPYPRGFASTGRGGGALWATAGRPYSFLLRPRLRLPWPRHSKRSSEEARTAGQARGGRIPQRRSRHQWSLGSSDAPVGTLARTLDTLVPPRRLHCVLALTRRPPMPSPACTRTRSATGAQPLALPAASQH